MVHNVNMASSKLRKQLHRQIQSNSVIVDTKHYLLAAGSNHLHYIWIRDICLSSHCLVGIGAHDALVSIIDLYFSKGDIHGDAVCYDNMDSTIRVLCYLLCCKQRFDIEYSELNAHYGNCALDGKSDSGILILYALSHIGVDYYTEHTNLPRFKDKEYITKKMKKVFRSYRASLSTGLIKQGSFSDFLDSHQRNGYTFLLNLFRYYVGKELKLFEEEKDAEMLLISLKKYFVDTDRGLILSHLPCDELKEKQKQNSELYECALDYLFCIQLNIDVGITKDQICNRIDFFYDYGLSINFHGTRFAALYFSYIENYHDDLIWGWVRAFSIDVLKKNNHKTAKQREKKFIQIIKTYETVHEVYDKDMVPLSSCIYKSETNFTMGILYTLNILLPSYS